MTPKEALKGIKYEMAIDIGCNDETATVLAELRDDKIYIIKEKRSNGTGENKITNEQLEKTHE